MHVSQIKIHPDPYQPFRLAQGYRVDELLFISGQAAIDEQGHIVGIGDFDRQARQAFANLEKVLRAGWSSYPCWLKHRTRKPVFNRLTVFA